MFFSPPSSGTVLMGLRPLFLDSVFLQMGCEVIPNTPYEFKYNDLQLSFYKFPLLICTRPRYKKTNKHKNRVDSSGFGCTGPVHGSNDISNYGSAFI